MSFDPLRYHPRLRKVAPWVVYAVVLVAALALAPGLGSVGVVAATAEAKQAHVFAPRIARVNRVAVRQGDSVLAGDVLATLDTTSIDLEIAIAKAELESFKVSAVAEVLDVRGSDLESVARLAQDAERAAVDLAQLVSEENRDRGELQQVEELIERQERLVAQGLASAEQRDELKLRRSAIAKTVAEYGPLLKAAREHERAARQRLNLWRSTRENKGSAGSPLEARTAPGQAEVAAQAERVRQLEAIRDEHTLKAPIAGKVADIFVHEGDTARLDLPVMSLVDDRPQRVIAWIDERAAQKVRIGDAVSLRPSDEHGPVRAGVVQALAPFISEVPLRFRTVPSQPVFGRAAFIGLSSDEAQPPLPGQAFDVVFLGGGSE